MSAGWPVQIKQPAPLNRLQPACQQSFLVVRPTATQNSAFLPRRWPKPSPVLIALTHRDDQAEWSWMNTGMV